MASNIFTWNSALPSANYNIQYNAVTNQWTTLTNFPPHAGFSINGYGYSVGGVVQPDLPYRQALRCGYHHSEVPHAYKDVVRPFFETFYKLTGMCYPYDAHFVQKSYDGSMTEITVTLGFTRKPEGYDGD